jgi:hypothetical protein
VSLPTDRIPRPPPALAEYAIAALVADPALREAVLGDLAEEFADRCARDGAARARSWYREQVVRSAPAFVAACWRRAPVGHRRTRPLLTGVVGGYLALLVLHLAAQFAAGVLLTPAGVADPAWAFVACSLVTGTGCALLGGYVAARAHPEAPLAAALTLALGCVALAATGMLVNGGAAPLWYWGGLQLLLFPLGACGGGLVRARQQAPACGPARD